MFHSFIHSFISVETAEMTHLGKCLVATFDFAVCSCSLCCFTLFLSNVMCFRYFKYETPLQLPNDIRPCVTDLHLCLFINA